MQIVPAVILKHVNLALVYWASFVNVKFLHRMAMDPVGGQIVFLLWSFAVAAVLLLLLRIAASIRAARLVRLLGTEIVAMAAGPNREELNVHNLASIIFQLRSFVSTLNARR